MKKSESPSATATHDVDDDLFGEKELAREPEELGPDDVAEMEPEKPVAKKKVKQDVILNPLISALAKSKQLPIEEAAAILSGGAPDQKGIDALVRTLRLDERFEVVLQSNRLFVKPAPMAIPASAFEVVVSSPVPEVAAAAELTIGEIAEKCHAANRAYCQNIGDHSQPEWRDAPQWQKDSAMKGVQLILDKPETTPKDSHESWYNQKISDGWTYGPEKDPATKRHPCLVAYEQLPLEQRAKDFLFGSIVRKLADLPPMEVPSEIAQLIVLSAEKLPRPEADAAKPAETPVASAPVEEKSAPADKVVQSTAAAWKACDQVVHDTFGPGVITEIKPGAVVIHFAKHGMRELSLTFCSAHLKRPGPAAGLVALPKPRVPLTEEQKRAREIELRRDRDDKIRDLSRKISQRKAAESELQNELNESREQTKETMKQLLQLSNAGFNLQESLSPAELVDFGLKPGAAAATPAKPKDSNVITTPAGDEDYQLGVAAAKEGKLEDACPFLAAVTPGKRAAWFSGFFDELRTTKADTPAIRHGLTDPKLREASKVLEPGKTAKIATVKIFEQEAYCIGTVRRGGETRYYLQPLCTPDEWSTLYLDKFGRSIAEADQSAEARTNRIKGGLDCGREVRVGKGVGKKYVVTPRSAVLVVTVADEPVSNGPKRVPERDHKQRAAGD